MLAVVSILLILLPWTHGLHRGVAAFGGLALGLLAFVFALWPRNYTAGVVDQVPFRLVPLRRLVRFPLFWIGLVFFALQLIATQNPSWFRESSGYAWTMTPLPSIDWLPTNVETSSKGFQGWRMLAIYATAWLVVCALWIGITRRRSLQIVSWVLVGNAVALAAVGAAHRLSGAADHLLLWTREIAHATAFGAFIYRNHAGAYFALMVGLAFALACWTHFDGRRRFAPSTPAPVWLFVGVAMIVAIAFTYSRSSLVIVALFVLLAALGYLIVRQREGAGGTLPKTVTVVLLLIVLSNGAFVVSRLDYSRLEHRFEAFQRLGANEVSLKMRVEARDRAVQMFQDHWVRGTGAGSFQFLFHRYVRNDPFLTTNGRFYWDHAHIDWLEIPIEQGIAGTALIALAFLWWLVRWFRNGGWSHPFALMIFFGALQTLLHAYVDFPFQHPAVLVTWWSLLIIALRWTEVEPAAGERQRA